MKKFLKYMIVCLLPLIAVSCVQEDMVVTGNEDIVLSFDSGMMTKAVADTDVEAYVSHVDVLIFDSEGNRYHHERVNNAGQTTFTLAKKRSDFGARAGYYVYLVANSTLAADKFASAADIDALKGLTQTDENIMFTGLSGMPEFFLMDAVAYAGSTEPQTPGTVVINDGVVSNSTQLNAVFRRAASKIFVTINKGADVVFAESSAARYYMRNCPVQTTVTEGYKINPTLVTPGAAVQNDNFVWDENVITVTAYAYAYDWENQSVQDKEASLVVNIPLTYNGLFHPNSWYKIPVSQTSSFERNHHYAVTVTINAPGAENHETPVELEGMKYEALPWEDVTISVGDQTSQPQYLQLNTNHVDMYNVNVDDSTLEFASSSEIDRITLNRAYFYNYLDQVVTVQSYNATAYRGINAQADAGLNGGITITSPFVNPDSHSNAVRYLEFTVRNKTGQTADFTVAQYPTIYITNERGNYSYRSDFGGTHYGNYVSGSNYSGANWTGGANGTWEYTANASGSNFFASKVVLGEAGSDGGYDLYYAYYNSRGQQQTTSMGGGGFWGSSGFDNPRMYHIHVTSTSAAYTIARPRLDADGYTESSADNADLVSPSFMIASQLGATEISSSGGNVPGGVRQAKEHCAQYVEVTTEGGRTVVYDDWRLPTAAEIQIIIDHQRESDAMAVVLTGTDYYCAYNGLDSRGNPIYTKVANATGGSGKSHVRCVRDAY